MKLPGEVTRNLLFTARAELARPPLRVPPPFRWPMRGNAFYW